MTHRCGIADCQKDNDVPADESQKWGWESPAPVRDHLFYKMRDTAGGYVYVHGDDCPAWGRHVAEILVDRLLLRQATGCTCGLPPSKEHR